MTTPAVVIAGLTNRDGAPAVASALLRRCSQASAAASFIVGPDFLDATARAHSVGRRPRSLDPILCGSDTVLPLYRHGSSGAEIAVIDGAAGLFDTAGSEGNSGSSVADVAEILSAPVILVVDVRGYGQSLAALLAGFVGYRSSISIPAVVLDGVRSRAHEAVLRDACAHVGVEVVGVLPPVSPAEQPDPYLDVERILALATRPVAGPQWNPADALADHVSANGRVVVALATGPAFDGGHPEYEELLVAAGATLCHIDPRVDDLPVECSALVLPHGAVDRHADELVGNHRVQRAVRALAERGGVIHAQGSASDYLAQTLWGSTRSDAPDDRTLPDHADFDDAEQARGGPTTGGGYRDAVALAKSALFVTGERVSGYVGERGTGPVGEQPAWGWRGDDGAVVDGRILGKVHASSLRVHPAGHPAFVGRFLSHAR